MSAVWVVLLVSFFTCLGFLGGWAVQSAVAEQRAVKDAPREFAHGRLMEAHPAEFAFYLEDERHLAVRLRASLSGQSVWSDELERPMVEGTSL